MNNLREAHAHIAQHGRAMSMLQFADCPSQSAFLERLAAAPRTSDWLLGMAVRVEAWPERAWPTLADLDAATGDMPACIWSFDYHALIVNSAAMRTLGFSPATPDPDHGRILRDSRNRPTGLLLEAAAKLAWSRIPEPPPSLRRAQVLAALQDLASHGFTEIHDLLAPPSLGPDLAAIQREGPLPIPRILLYPLLPDLPSVAATARDWESDSVRLAGAKVFVDGTLNSRTALMLHDYADPLPGMPRGQAMMSQAQIESAMAEVQRITNGRGHLAAHAIGDAAARTCLDAYERFAGSVPSCLRASVPSFRIEHAELIDEADVPRFAKLGVVCSVQPCHLLADVEALTRGQPHRLHRVLPLRELIDSGCSPGELLWFGSDTPIVRPHPEDSIQAAVHRRRAGAPDTAAIAPEQAIEESEARRCFTAC